MKKKQKSVSTEKLEIIVILFHYQQLNPISTRQFYLTDTILASNSLMWQNKKHGFRLGHLLHQSIIDTYFSRKTKIWESWYPFSTWALDKIKKNLIILLQCNHWNLKLGSLEWCVLVAPRILISQQFFSCITGMVYI